MDIRSYFGGRNSPSASSISREAESEVDSRNLEINTPKKSATKNPEKRNGKRDHDSVYKSKDCMNWDDIPWLKYDEDYKGVFCKVCMKSGKSLQQTGRVWAQAIYKFEECCRKDENS